MNMNKETTQTTDDNYLDEFSGAGFEGIRASDFAVPFLRVIQPTSPETIKGDPSYVPGAEAGTFMNSLTHEIYGASIEVIPVKSEPIWLEYTPKMGDKRGDFQGKHPVNAFPVTGNPFDGLFRIDNGNEIRETIVFYCLIKGHEHELPVAFSLTASMIKHGKSWNSLIYTVRTPSGRPAAYFSSYWKVSLTLNQNESGRWYNIGTRSANVERIGFVPREVLLLAANTRKLLDADSVKVDFAQITEGEKTALPVTDASEY